MALSNDPEYGTKPEKPKPIKIKKKVIVKPKPNKIQQSLEEEKARRDKYSGGVGGWFSKQNQSNMFNVFNLYFDILLSVNKNTGEYQNG